MLSSVSNDSIGSQTTVSRSDKLVFMIRTTSDELGLDTPPIDTNITILQISEDVSKILEKLPRYSGVIKELRLPTFYLKIDNLDPVNLQTHVLLYLQVLGYLLSKNLSTNNPVLTVYKYDKINVTVVFNNSLFFL